MIEISVIIPCYNEEKILPDTIKHLERFFFKHRNKFKYEIVFVDDGSTDNTYNILDSYANSKLRVMPSQKNFGKGHAVRRGLLLSKYHNKLILDADLSVRPEELLETIKQHDLNDNYNYIITGERIQVTPQPFYRIIAGWVFSLLHKVLLDLPVSDSQCPFKLLHNIEGELINRLEIDGFAYDCELLYKAKNLICVQHVEYHNNPDSRVTPYKTIKMFFELLRIRTRKINKQ